MSDQQRLTTFASICVVLLREMRVERGFHQAQIGEFLERTPSAWAKVEAGQSALQFETFIRASNSMQVSPSIVLATAERYAALLSQNNWAVLTSPLDFKEDHLLRETQAYWATPSARALPRNTWGVPSILSGPTYNLDGTISLAAVFQFVLDEKFRTQQLAQQIPQESIII